MSDSYGKTLAEHRVYEKIRDDFGDETELVPKVFFYAEGPLAGQMVGIPFMMRIIIIKRSFSIQGAAFHFLQKFNSGMKKIKI